MNSATPSAHRISIVMLTYNEYQTTKACIESILPALANDFISEFIIWDNDSSDGTRSYVSSLADIKKMKIILSDENLGVAGGRKKLFAEAGGDIIASLDSDVLLTDVRFFNKALKVLTTEMNVGICGMSGYFVGMQNDTLMLKKCMKEGYTHCVSGCCHIFWRYLLGAVSFDDAFSPFWCEDTDFCFQILAQHKRIYYIPPEYGLFHEYRSKIHRRNDQSKYDKEKYLVEKWKNRLSFNKGKLMFNALTTKDPRLWVLKWHPSAQPLGFDPQWYPEHAIITPDNVQTYLPELKNMTVGNPALIQLLLLFKYGGVCIDFSYIHLDNIFKSLFHMLSEKNVDLILLRHHEKIQEDIIVGKKGSTYLHKSLFINKIKSFEELVGILGNKCMVIDHLIDPKGTDESGSFKLIKRKSGVDNARFYDMPPLSFRDQDKESIHFFDMPGHHINPCVKADGPRYYLIARNESDPDAPLTSTTKNVLFYMDANFNTIWKHDLTLVIDQSAFIQRNRRHLSNENFIVEDIRFIENTQFQNGKIWVYASAMVDYEKNYLTRMALFELDVDRYRLTFIKFLNILPQISSEKNWLIYHKNHHFYVIYAMDPFVVYKFSSNFELIGLCRRQDYQIYKNFISHEYSMKHRHLHLGAISEYDHDYYLLLFRLYTYDAHYHGHRKRIYRQFCALMHKQTMNIDYIYSHDLFSRYSYNFIIANGAKKISDAIYFFCGFDDKKSGYIRWDIKTLQQKLKAL